MAHYHFSTKKIGDVDALLPGFKAVWPEMKALCHTTQRCPKSVTFTDTPEQVCANDYDSAKRFSLDLRTMQITGSVHISCGEWVTPGAKNNDGAVPDVPENMALITCTYNDFHRCFSMTVQVKELPKQLAAKSEPW
jgi:hypothetical protein